MQGLFTLSLYLKNHCWSSASANQIQQVHLSKPLMITTREMENMICSTLFLQMTTEILMALELQVFVFVSRQRNITIQPAFRGNKPTWKGRSQAARRTP